MTGPWHRAMMLPHGRPLTPGAQAAVCPPARSNAIMWPQPAPRHRGEEPEQWEQRLDSWFIIPVSKCSSSRPALCLWLQMIVIPVTPLSNILLIHYQSNWSFCHCQKWPIRTSLHCNQDQWKCQLFKRIILDSLFFSHHVQLSLFLVSHKLFTMSHVSWTPLWCLNGPTVCQ